jgi:hypothetical protein
MPARCANPRRGRQPIQRRMSPPLDPLPLGRLPSLLALRDNNDVAAGIYDAKLRASIYGPFGAGN